MITAVCFLIIGYIMDDLLQDTEKEYLTLVLLISPVVGIVFYRILLLIRLS
jgi:hypothetical protein